MSATYEEMHDQMMQWGAQRDALRETLAEVEARCARLETENGRLRATMRLINDRSAAVLDA